MPITINLKKVNDKYTSLLFQFFSNETHQGISFWKKDTPYVLSDGTEVTLKNDMFQRERKAGHLGVRYDLISNKSPLGQGKFGQVNKIKGTVAFDQNLIRFKKEGKEGKKRVVKVQTHTEEYNQLYNLYNEYEISLQAGHLHTKKPTIIEPSEEKQISYTTMKLMPGCTLADLIIANTLTTAQRLELSKGLLFALKTQVTDKGLVHRDIKPANIMVQLGSPIKINIIDYGISMEITNPDGQICGTPYFYAPELVRDPWSINEKADVFSMARVIALLWNVNLDTYRSGRRSKHKFFHATATELIQDLFQNIDGIDKNAKKHIKETLVGMLNKDTDKRFSIEQAIQHLKSNQPSVIHTFFVKKTEQLFNNMKHVFHKPQN